MRAYVVIRYIGMVLLLNAGFMLISFFVSLHHGDQGQLPLLLSAVLSALVGVFPMVFVPAPRDISNKEGYLIVVLSWLVVGLFGMLPYALYGGEFTLVNSWFESISGYTTTGASILTDIEAVSYGILFWRSSTHWIGGVGVVLFVLVIMPALGNTRLPLSRLEMSPLAKTHFNYRANKTLRVVILVYVGLTVAQSLLLLLMGMNLFDAVTHTFATVSTGGFSPKNMSIGYYNSLGIEVVVMLFMFLSGMHFGMLYTMFGFRSTRWFRSPVLRFYAASMAIAIATVTISNYGSVYSSWGESLRHSAFQVMSIGTTTGFATANSAVWPSFSIMVLLYFYFQCACAGSTAGGIKVDRMVILFQSLRRQVLKLQHPQAVIPVRVQGQAVDDETVGSVLLFIALYILIVFGVGLALSAMGVDATTAFSASAATLSTVGPGFGEVGSVSNYAGIPDLGKLLLTLNMLLGRLEIFGLLLLLFIRSWR